MRSWSRVSGVGVGLAALVLVVSACSAPEDDSASGDGETDCDQFSSYKTDFPDISGKSVSIYTGIVTPEDKPQIDSYKDFEECTGVTVN